MMDFSQIILNNLVCPKSRIMGLGVTFPLELKIITWRRFSFLESDSWQLLAPSWILIFRRSFRPLQSAKFETKEDVQTPNYCFLQYFPISPIMEPQYFWHMHTLLSAKRITVGAWPCATGPCQKIANPGRPRLSTPPGPLAQTSTTFKNW